MHSDKTIVQDLVNLLVQRGLQHVVISPGSRHAPLSLTFFHHPDVTVHVIPDERAAGYFALGMAQYTRRPIALVCTSGTAVANYGAAAAEAFYQQLPLIFLSADRPQEWVDQGDGQTIRQSGILDLHVRASFDLRQDDDHPDVRWHNQRMINEAWEAATDVPSGPVHLNVGLREPLYGLLEVSNGMAKARKRLRGTPKLDDAQLASLATEFSRYERVLVIAGQHPPLPELQSAVATLSTLPNVLVLSETTSNLSTGEFVGCIDRLIMTFDDEDIRAFVPELLITFGGQIISKKIKALLRKHLEGPHWHISPEGVGMDTFQKLSVVVESDIAQVLSRLSTQSCTGTYHSDYYPRHTALSTLQQDVAEDMGWSDLQVFNRLLPRLPEHSILQMGNSSVVRYIQLFDQRSDIQYFGNRGTSGIDGCTSTAAGMAALSDRTVTLISGDIAFLYDINGLWHRENHQKLRIVVINNGGGNIFRIIDGPSSTEALETIFEARHGQNVEHLAAHFGLDYRSADSAKALDDALTWLYEGEQCRIVEVFTKDIASDEVLKASFRETKKRLKQE